MSKRWPFVFRRTTLVAAVVGLAAVARAQNPAGGSFTLTGADLAPTGTIGESHVYNGFGCSGKNQSPALSWKNAPAGTKSFALTMYDPDAPTGSGWWHWVIYDIPASATSLPAGAGDPKGSVAPAGSVQGNTDFGMPGYGGPCPPPGAPHPYIFTLYALKVDEFPVAVGGTAAGVECNPYR